MSTRGVSLDEYTSFESVSRFCKSNVCAINYEEPTPEHWSHSVGNSSLGGGNTPAPSSSAPPPPPRTASSSRARRESGTASRPLVTGPAAGTRGAAIARNLKSATATQRFVIDRVAAQAALEPSMGEELDEEDIGGQLILPPAPPAFPSVRRGEVLLPEHSHDPTYYPGLVNDPEPDPEMPRKWPGWANYVAGGVGLFIAGLIARGVMSGPSTWSAVIDVTPPEAHVTVDGQTLDGSGSPRTREGLIAGDHVLVAEQPGYVSKREVFSMSGTDRRVVVILDHEKKPEPVAEPSEPDPVAQLEPSAPAAAAPAIEPLRDLSSLSKKELAKLKRREKIAERYRARKAASADRGSKAESRAAAKEAKAAARVAAKEERAGKRGAASGEPKERAAKASSGATGLLKLNTIPWSEVYVDKKHVGHTPVLGLPVSAGRHTVEFKNPSGPHKKLKVQVHAGETVTKIEKLGG